jgi:glycine cleavage system aminomethyltransferase T
VARQIVGLRVNDGDWLPMAGSPVFDAAQAQVGVVTSSTLSPVRSNAALCLAFVKRPHVVRGTTLHVPAEGAIRPVTVVEIPFAA